MAARIPTLQRHALSRGALRLSRPAWPSSRLSATYLTPVRAASTTTTTTSSQAAGNAKSGLKRFKNLFLGTTLVFAGTAGYLYATDTRASYHQWLVPRIIRTVWSDAEDAHHVGTVALETLYEFGLHPRERGDPDGAGDLQITVFGHTLDNPIGISAGLDKNAEIPDPLFALGPAIVEVGGITPKPQEGNAKPRVFRVVSQNALINRYGLNSEGADNIAQRLRQRVREFAYQIGFGIGEEGERAVLDGLAGVPPGSLTPGKLMCVQVAKNKTTPDADIEAVKDDYVYCVDRLARYADVIVVNVSSPNTPGLRTLQRVEPLTRILTGVVSAAKAVDRKCKPAVMVKVSPDEDTDEQISGICEAIWDSGVDGVIVGNTTKQRPDPLPKGYVLPSYESQTLLEQGGYSGPQMFNRTVALVSRYRRLLDQGPVLPKSQASEDAKALTGPNPGDAPENSVIDKIEAGSDTSSSASPTATVGSSTVQLHLPDSAEPFSSSSNPDDIAESAPAVTAPSPSSTIGLESPLAATPSTPTAATSAVEETLSSPFDHPRKEIWATGGVATGQDALKLLNAGASVAMIYTTMVYNGSGTVTRIKNEMREEVKKR